MQLRAQQPEFEKRFNCQATASKSEKLTHDDVTQQINEFIAKGGTIKAVSTGIAAVAYGAVIVGDESIETPRPKKSCNTDHEFISMTMAATAANKSRSWVTRRVKDGLLSIVIDDKSTGAKLLKRSDVIALAKKENGENNE